MNYAEPRRQQTSIDRIASFPEPVLEDFRGLTSPDGAITLMLSDIADAASLADQLGAERWEQLLRDHRGLVERIVTSRDGHIGRFEGDGFFASFNSAHAALQAALELKRAFAELAAAAGVEQAAVRSGLNSGFVLATPDQPQGRNVVLAARIAAHAKAGEVLVSSSLKQYTERDPRFHFELHGEHHFKGLVGEHTVFAVRWS